MKIKDLIHSLSSLNPELEVILQKDSEGNGYSPLDGYACGTYAANNDWSGEFSEEEQDDSIHAVVLYPIN